MRTPREGLQWKSRNEAKRNEELQRKARPEQLEMIALFCKRWKGTRPKIYDFLRISCQIIMLTLE